MYRFPPSLGLCAVPESIVQTPPPPPPRRYLNPSNSSSGGEAFPQVALVAVLVAAGLLVSCALMVCYPAWKKARLEAQAESADLDGFMQNNVTHLKDQPFANNGAVARTSTVRLAPAVDVRSMIAVA